MQDSEQAIADRVAGVMLARDNLARRFGIVLEAIGTGHAVVSMTVDADVLNGVDTCHGGAIFTLADTAFGLACNSRNHLNVGLSCGIDFLAPARRGERLNATAVERSLTRRGGVYDIEIRADDGRLIAIMRARSHRLDRPFIPEVDDESGRQG